jgi:diguanylate cyclase (GGDEF)-like protein
VSDPAPAATERALATALGGIARADTPEAELLAVVAAAAGAVGAERGTVLVWDSDQGRLALAAASGYPDGAEAAMAASVADDPDHPLHRVAVEQRPAVGFRRTRADGFEMVGVGLPLRVSRGGIDEPIGVLGVGRAAPWALSDDEVATLEAFAALAALTIDRARLAALADERGDWQERLAHTDALTGLANARTVSRVLELELARSSRQGTELSLVLLDVDGLAGVNGSAGPTAGDAVLREVAAVVAETVRLVDSVARWGGDEFLVVAPGSAGAAVARRIVDAVAARAGALPGGLTVSAGVARFPLDGATADDLLGAAGRALAAAKATGRGAIGQGDSGPG